MKSQQSRPASWEWVSLEEIGHWEGGGTPSKARIEFWDGGTIPWVSPKDMKTAEIWDSEDHITADAIENSATQLIPAGSVLIVTRSGILQHTLPVASTRVPVTINQDLKAITPYHPIDTEYVRYALMRFSEQILRDCSKAGTTVASIVTAELKRFKIPLAPENEQRRIVRVLDESFSRLDAADTALARIQANLKRYRASVLKAACEGRLVPTEAELARREGRDYEPAHVLLDRILKERRKRWEEQELAKLRAQGKEPKDDRWKRRYKEPEPPDTSGLPELPEGWVWVTGEQLFTWASGKNLPKSSLRSGDVVVFGGNGVAGMHDEALVEFKTLAIGRVGANCGNVHVTPGRAWITDNAIYATQRPNDCVLEYLALVYLNADLNAGAAGSGQPFVNQRMLNEVAIPLPPRAEQKRIVNAYERHISLIQNVEHLTSQQLKRSHLLRQAILKRAFEGRLVPQNPTDEPAAVLLERIRSQRNGKRVKDAKNSRVRGRV